MSTKLEREFEKEYFSSISFLQADNETDEIVTELEALEVPNPISTYQFFDGSGDDSKDLSQKKFEYNPLDKLDGVPQLDSISMHTTLGKSGRDFYGIDFSKDRNFMKYLQYSNKRWYAKQNELYKDVSLKDLMVQS